MAFFLSYWTFGYKEYKNISTQNAMISVIEKNRYAFVTSIKIYTSTFNFRLSNQVKNVARNVSMNRNVCQYNTMHCLLYHLQGQSRATFVVNSNLL